MIDRRTVRIVSAPGCHLCESALRVIESVRAEIPFELEQTDITEDPELEARFRERIPVVFVDGEEAFTFFVHPDALRRQLLARDRCGRKPTAPVGK